jgi:hypothetical protein
MARYTGLFVVAVPIDRLRQLLYDVFESCGCEVIYDTGDYMMAREIPGRISYTKLVKAEVIIHRPSDENQDIRMKVEMKNEELPLQYENHCRQMFDYIWQAITQNRQWQVVESTAG